MFISPRYHVKTALAGRLLSWLLFRFTARSAAVALFQAVATALGFALLLPRDVRRDLGV